MITLEQAPDRAADDGDITELPRIVVVTERVDQMNLH